MSGWGTNLSRVGLEAAARLVGPEGVLGIVMPASFCADTNSTSLRRWFAENYGVRNIDYYPAEARLFDNVDQPFVSIVADAIGPTAAFCSATYDPVSGQFGSSGIDRYDQGSAVFAAGPFAVVSEFFTSLPTVESLEGVGPSDWWLGRELDETRDRPYLTTTGDLPFLKGRSIHRFGMLPLAELKLDLGRRAAPRSTQVHRVAWRDVARPNMRRRMCASVIPPGHVTGNSLNVAMRRDGDASAVRALAAVMNSFWFEAQVRARLGTSHFSPRTVKFVRVPNLRDDWVCRELSGIYAWRF
jgi:Alw26I/Eco31I/Esp3I family type II restriction m6 adenine DNA methyltransferase